MTEKDAVAKKKDEQGSVGGANAPERLPDWMRRNHEAVQVPIRRDMQAALSRVAPTVDAAALREALLAAVETLPWKSAEFLKDPEWAVSEYRAAVLFTIHATPSPTVDAARDVEEQVIRDWLAGQLNPMTDAPLSPSQRLSQPLPRRQVVAVVAYLIHALDKTRSTPGDEPS